MLFVILVSGNFLVPQGVQALTMLEVNSAADTDDGTCDASSCTLREAINAANAVSAGDQYVYIFLATSLNGNTITLGSDLPPITRGVWIAPAPGAVGITINGNGHRIFHFAAVAATNAVYNLTMTGADASFGSVVVLGNGASATLSGCIITGNHTAYGGMIYSRGTLVVENCTLSNNTMAGAGSSGGGGEGTAIQHMSSGPLTVRDTIISGNILGDCKEGGTVYITPNPGAAIALTFERVTVSGNQVSGEGCQGAGLHADSSTAGSSLTATITDSSFANNSIVSTSHGVGGGLYMAGPNTTVTLTGSTISGNAARNGGGIYLNGASLTMSTSTISSNQAVDGGGIYGYAWSGSSLSIAKSTISGNSATGDGGGIRLAGQLNASPAVLFNSTISGNSADAGGGLYVGSWDMFMRYCTVYGNTSTATFAAAGFAVSSPVALDLDIAENIFADNTAGAAHSNCSLNPEGFAGGTSAYNLDTDGTCWRYTGTASIFGTQDAPLDAGLGPLQDNGGPTMTHALLSGSPAIDGGDPLSAVTYDQRDEPRPLDGNYDGNAVNDMGPSNSGTTAPTAFRIKPSEGWTAADNASPAPAPPSSPPERAES